MGKKNAMKKKLTLVCPMFKFKYTYYLKNHIKNATRKHIFLLFRRKDLSDFLRIMGQKIFIALHFFKEIFLFFNLRF